MEGSGASASGRRKMPAYSDIGYVGEACAAQAVLNMGSYLQVRNLVSKHTE